jgi:stage II sporulation protein D
VPRKPSVEQKPVVEAPPAVRRERGEPTLRVAILTNSTKVTIASDATFYLLAKTPETAKSAWSGEVSLALEGGPQNDPQPARTVFRVQIASVAKEADAEALKRKLEREFSQPAIHQFSAETKTYGVRIGAFARREEALKLASELKGKGYREAIVIQDTGIIGADTALRRIALRSKNTETLKSSPNGFLFMPESDSTFIKVNGKPYRGVIDALINRNGKITVVNELSMEAYLRGVVPNELPPKAFPELEALKAQAIAARTYAIRNLGQFAVDGFDLLATDRSQVYNGVESEQELSTRAVVETAGLVIYYNNEPINALYTSTCGGRTENYENMFSGKPVPYLRSVSCAPDLAVDEAQGEIRGRTKRNENGTTSAVDGDEKDTVLNHEQAMLVLAGVLNEEEVSDEYMASEPESREIEQWVARVAELTKRRSNARSRPPEPGPVRMVGFAVYLADTIFGKDASDVMISSADARYYLANFRDAGQVPEAAKKRLALLLQKNILLPYPDNTLRPTKPPARRTALSMLYRTLENLSAIPMASGTIQRAYAKGIQVKNARQTLELKLADDLYLFQRIGKELVATSSLRVVGGEEARYYVKDNQVRYLEIKLGARGVANDRFSRFSQWEVPMTADEVTKKLKGTFSLGNIVDLQPAKFGASQRVTELKVIGTRGEFTLKGLKIRSVLGLRDTLFTIAREYAPNGAIQRFIFTGKGWGHGIGLCQTGAYGMALAGEKFDAILKKYYSGVEIKKMY